MIKTSDISNRITTWSTDRMNEYNNLETELNALGVYSWLSTYDSDRDQFNCFTIIDGVTVNFSPKNYQKRYGVFIYENKPYIKWEDTKKIREKLEKPNEIGILHINKVKAWVNYVLEINHQEWELSKEKQARVKAFLSEFKNAGGQYNEPSSGYNSGGYSGRIEKNGLEYSFEIDDTGYIKQDIRVSYLETRHKLDAFLKLADNKFIK